MQNIYVNRYLLRSRFLVLWQYFFTRYFDLINGYAKNVDFLNSLIFFVQFQVILKFYCYIILYDNKVGIFMETTLRQVTYG